MEKFERNINKNTNCKTIFVWAIQLICLLSWGAIDLSFRFNFEGTWEDIAQIYDLL